MKPTSYSFPFFLVIAGALIFSISFVVLRQRDVDARKPAQFEAWKRLNNQPDATFEDWKTLNP